LLIISIKKITISIRDRDFQKKNLTLFYVRTLTKFLTLSPVQKIRGPRKILWSWFWIPAKSRYGSRSGSLSICF